MNPFSRSYVYVWIFASFVSFSFGQQQTDPLAEADQLFGNREYSRALEAYEKLFDQTTDIPTKARIKLHIGKTYRMLRQYDRSIERFKEVAALEGTNEPSEQKPRFPRYHSGAEWEISKTLYAKGDFEQALAVFRSFRAKHKTNSGCGNCNESIEKDKNVTEGIFLEALGRHKEAVIPYLRADESHLVELYDKAGQLEDLREIVEQNIADLMRKRSWRRDYAMENSPYRNLIMLVYAYDLEKAGNWPELVKLAFAYDRRRDFGRSNIPSMILARNAHKILPLLRDEINRMSLARQMGVIYEILAISGKADSIALLNELSSKHGLRSESLLILGRIYRLANEQDRKLLRDIKSLSNLEPWARFFFERDDIDEFGRFEIKFPAIGEVPKLPKLDDLKDLLP